MATRKKANNQVRRDERPGLQLKSFPAALRRQVKSRAAACGLTVHEYAVDVFIAALKGEKG